MSDHVETFEIAVNGQRRRAAVEADATLLTWLRDGLQATGTKRGCNQGVCGSCTVMIDGWPQRACLSLAAACEGREVRTVEGYGDDAVMRTLQRRFAEGGAVQCGFCTSGMLISARRLLADSPRPDEAEVRAALSGNLCRCTGYKKIVDAVLLAAEELAP